MFSENTFSSITLASQKIKEKDYPSAENILLSYLQEHKQDSKAFFTLGNVYHFLGKFDRAILCYRKAIELNPHYAEATLSLSILYNDLGRYQEGKELFHQLQQQPIQEKKLQQEKIDETLSQKHLELGRIYETYQRYKEAEVEYKKAFALTPASTECKTALSRVQLFVRL